MGSVNKAMLVGNLGRDAEMRYTKGGTAVSSFSIATTERFTDKEGQKREDTQWHRIVVWGKMAESITEYLTKGKQVYVEGRLQTREWEGRDGSKQKSTEIRAERVVLLGGGRRDEDAQPRRGKSDDAETYDGDDGDTQPVAATPSEDDIPF